MENFDPGMELKMAIVEYLKKQGITVVVCLALSFATGYVMWQIFNARFADMKIVQDKQEITIKEYASIVEKLRSDIDHCNMAREKLAIQVASLIAKKR